MAFGATLTITVNAVAKVLNKVKEQDYGSEYKLIEPSGEYLVKIQHSVEKATAAGTIYDRHFVDFKHTVYGVSPAPDIVREAYLVVRNARGDGLVNPGYLLAGAIDVVDVPQFQADILGWLS